RAGRRLLAAAGHPEMSLGAPAPRNGVRSRLGETGDRAGPERTESHLAVAIEGGRPALVGREVEDAPPGHGQIRDLPRCGAVLGEHAEPVVRLLWPSAGRHESLPVPQPARRAELVIVQVDGAGLPRAGRDDDEVSAVTAGD